MSCSEKIHALHIVVKLCNFPGDDIHIYISTVFNFGSFFFPYEVPPICAVGSYYLLINSLQMAIYTGMEPCSIKMQRDLMCWERMMYQIAAAEHHLGTIPEAVG